MGGASVTNGWSAKDGARRVVVGGGVLGGRPMIARVGGASVCNWPSRAESAVNTVSTTVVEVLKT